MLIVGVGFIIGDVNGWNEFHDQWNMFAGSFTIDKKISQLVILMA